MTCAIDELHDEKVQPFELPELVHTDDVRVTQSCQRAGLAAEALGRAHAAAGRQHLQGDQPIERRLPSLVNGTHAASAQQLEHLKLRKQARNLGQLRWFEPDPGLGLDRLGPDALGKQAGRAKARQGPAGIGWPQLGHGFVRFKLVVMASMRSLPTTEAFSESCYWKFSVSAMGRECVTPTSHFLPLPTSARFAGHECCRH